jgi:hypothetical protein
MAIAETETEAGDRPARPRGRRRRRLLRGGWRIAVLSLVSVVAFGVAVAGLVALLLMRGPLTLPDWVAAPHGYPCL